jgi:hypothetical protein
MLRHTRQILWISLMALSVGFAATACSSADVLMLEEQDDNPFLDPSVVDGKADTYYYNPYGVEIEVDIEGEVEAPSYKLSLAPAILGQFAMTYLRERELMYLESLAEQASSSKRVEWLVAGVWMKADDLDGIADSELKRFRIRGINAVLLNDQREWAEEGVYFEAPVPLKPFSIYADAGTDCATHDSHMPANQSIYWYLWNPEKPGCTAETTMMKITVTKVLEVPEATYPEYDKLTEDGKITAVVLFGQIGDGATVSEYDTGVRSFKQMARWLERAGFTEDEFAPVGRRFMKRINGIEFEIDLYSPHDFSGLSDMANFDNFQTALGEHEIVVYDGHSMLGASDFWARPNYPENYQIFVYGGCLGYEYYIHPILEGKDGWDNLDIISSVIEVSADANKYAGPLLAKMIKAIKTDYQVSWQEILKAVRNGVGDATFGASGVSENCYSPYGSRCD